MSRRKKFRRAGKPSIPRSMLTIRDSCTLTVVDGRLQRCCDLMSCIDYCLEQGAELDLAALALAARDLLDAVRADLIPLRGQVVRP